MAKRRARRRSSRARTARRGMFYSPPKHPQLARIISIRSKEAFVRAVRKLSSQKNYNITHYRALLLAQNRAKAMLKKKNLSPEVRRRLRAIAQVRIPKPKK